MKKMSVKLKVTLWFTLAMLVISSIVLVTMNSLGNKIIKNDMHDRMFQAVEAMSRQAVDREGNVRHVPEFMFFDRGVQMALYDTEYNIIGGQTPFGLKDAFDFKEDEMPRTENYAGKRYLILDRQIAAGNNNYWIRGIMSLTEESLMLQSNFKINMIMTVVLICLAALGGYFIISRAFVPMGKISKTATEIADSSDLTQRINIGKGSDEISELANTFDKMLDKLEQTFEREKQFTSDASHELRTPVAVIISECEYMSECAKTSEEFIESAETIKRQADKMSKLISELLMISRMDQNTFLMNFEELDVSELLNFVCDEQEELNPERKPLVREITNNITAAIDCNSMTRLFINLISNAYKYTGADGNIQVSLTKDDANVRFSVKDNGIGIAKEEQPKIWTRFYQVDSARTSTETGSAGLGLSMVKWIAESHNGKITVESELGQGSEFVVSFPQKI